MRFKTHKRAGKKNVFKIQFKLIAQKIMFLCEMHRSRWCVLDDAQK